MTDQYLVLDENFAPTAPAFTIDPRDWEKRDRDLTFEEEPLESVLAFHMALMTGRPIDFVQRTRYFGGRPDAYGVGDDGRLHVFEAKMEGKGGRQSAVQLLGYLRDPGHLLDYISRPERGKSVFGGELSEAGVILDYLLGALTGARMANRPAPEGIADKVRRCGFDPVAERSRLEPAAVAIRDRLQIERGRAQGRLTGQSPPVVGWLVAPHITRPARKLLEKAPAPCPELHILELEIARLPPRGWVVRRGTETVLPARP